MQVGGICERRSSPAPMLRAHPLLAVPVLRAYAIPSWPAPMMCAHACPLPASAHATCLSHFPPGQRPDCVPVPVPSWPASALCACPLLVVPVLCAWPHSLLVVPVLCAHACPLPADPTGLKAGTASPYHTAAESCSASWSRSGPLGDAPTCTAAHRKSRSCPSAWPLL